MKYYLSLIALFSFVQYNFAQCDTVEIAPSSYAVQSISSENGNNTGNLLFDGDSDTRWRTSGANSHEIVIDLGASENVTAISLETRWSGTGKVADFEVYVSNVPGQWGLGDQFGMANYSSTSGKTDTIYFGDVSGRFVRLKCTSTAGDLQLSELRFLKNTCTSSNKQNQPLKFDAIDKQETNASPITLFASSQGTGTISYSIVSGPATVSGSLLSLTKQAGDVTVRASISGSTTHHANTRDISFKVVDLSTYDPIVTTRLTEDYAIELADSSNFYPIYIHTEIPESGFLSVKGVEVDIDGEVISAQPIDARTFYVAWNPDAYETHEIKITAEGSNGNKTSISKTVEVIEGGTSKTVTSLKDVVIEFQKENSRNYYGTYTLPQFTGVYDKVIAKLEVECPNGNCDDWDRWAHFDFKAPDGNWIQFIRYMTPYNVGCTHEIDVTEYASLLQGELDFHVFIDTWGTGGWQLTVDFEYVKGQPAYTYTTLEEVWDGRFDFGNMNNLESVDDQIIEIPSNTEQIDLVMSTSGHGWGANNTGNAAEFYRAKHDIMVNDKKELEQDLWNDCDPNPDNCLNQQGTWYHDRAGWCPGAIAPPQDFNLSKFKDEGAIKLGYKFQSTYRDFCHPNNPNCVTGTTCADCNAGYNPHYNVDVVAVFHSNDPLVYGLGRNSVREFATSIEEEKTNYTFEVFPNPTNGLFSVQAANVGTQITGALFSIDGTQHQRFYFETVEELETFNFNVSNLESGVYFLELDGAEGKGFQQIVVQ